MKQTHSCAPTQEQPLYTPSLQAALTGRGMPADLSPVALLDLSRRCYRVDAKRVLGDPANDEPTRLKFHDVTNGTTTLLLLGGCTITPVRRDSVNSPSPVHVAEPVLVTYQRERQYGPSILLLQTLGNAPRELYRQEEQHPHDTAVSASISADGLRNLAYLHQRATSEVGVRISAPSNNTVWLSPIDQPRLGAPYVGNLTLFGLSDTRTAPFHNPLFKELDNSKQFPCNSGETVMEVPNMGNSQPVYITMARCNDKEHALIIATAKNNHVDLFAHLQRYIPGCESLTTAKGSFLTITADNAAGLTLALEQIMSAVNTPMLSAGILNAS